MAKFTVTLTNEAHLAGMTAARLRYNARLPTGAMPFFSDNEYIQFMVEKAAERYATEFAQSEAPVANKVEQPVDQLETELAARLAAELLRDDPSESSE